MGGRVMGVGVCVCSAEALNQVGAGRVLRRSRGSDEDHVVPLRATSGDWRRVSKCDVVRQIEGD